MTRIAPSLAAVTLAALGAQSAPERSVEPNAAEVLLDRMEAKRFGGRKGGLQETLRLRGWMKVEIPGSTSSEPLAAELEIAFDGPRTYERMDFGAQGLSLQGSDEELAWMTHPVWGDQIFEGATEAALRRLSGIVRGAPWRTLYEAAERVGDEDEAGSARPVLRLWADDEYDTWVLDAATLLPARIEILIPEEDSAERAKVEYWDWRPVDGVLFPFAERCAMGGSVTVTTYDAIEAGVAIPQERFAVPDAIRKLAETRRAEPRSGAMQPSAQIVECEEQAVASIRVKVRSDEVQRTLASLLPEVMAWITESGATPIEAPFARFHGEGDGTIDLEAGVPIATPIAPRGRVRPSTLPGGRAAISWYSGPYSGLTEARERLARAVVAMRVVPRGGPWIYYRTDKVIVPDLKRRLSQLVQPID